MLRLIETRVVFEFDNLGRTQQATFRLIETRVVFELGCSDLNPVSSLD